MNARIVDRHNAIVAGDIVIDDGRVISVGPSSGGAAADEVIDLDGRIVIPGVIDGHIHSGLMPRLAATLRSETAFSASGGVTTEIRHLRHPSPYADVIGPVLAVADHSCHQDFAYHLSLFNQRQVADMPSYVDRYGVTSFKIYMQQRGRLGAGMLMNQTTPDSADFVRRDVDYDNSILDSAFGVATTIGANIRIVVHAEDGEIVAHELGRAQNAGHGGLAGWEEGRPQRAEAAAIHVAGTLSRAHHSPLYIAHVGSAGGLRAVRELRALGTDVTVETCPHYLFLEPELLADPVTGKIMPPVRTADPRHDIVNAIRDGDIDVVASDHIPHTLAEKSGADVWHAGLGLPGSGYLLPLLLGRALAGGSLSLGDVVRVTSYNPAKAFGLLGRKGALEPGWDGDLVAIEKAPPGSVAAGAPSRAGWNPYAGLPLGYRVAMTMVRGNVVFDAQSGISDTVVGRYLKRIP